MAWAVRQAQGLELLQLALAQAPSPFDFEGVRNAKRAPVAAQRPSAPARGELLEVLVVKACDLGRRGQGGHGQRRMPIKSWTVLCETKHVGGGSPPLLHASGRWISFSVPPR